MDLKQIIGSGAAGASPTYIEDVFSTYLYTGNGSTQTITNGIDLAGNGGLVWLKDRTSANPAWIMDTVRGVASTLQPSTTGAAGSISNAITAFNSNGFSIGANGNSNTSSNNYASWTFRKQPKFVDVVTWTGDGVSGRTISHSLGSTPGCIMIKCTSKGGTPSGWIVPSDWWVFHRGLASPSNFSLRLNTTAAQNNSGGLVADTTTFTVYGNTTASNMPNNVSGETYVAYLFAHNAGGFGLTGTDNVISCGSFTTDSLGFSTVTLGYELQWVLVKPSSAVGNWQLYDNMRGMAIGASQNVLYPNLSNAETGTSNRINLSATGFQAENSGSTTYIYIAIRRGPMKVPTDGTKVFSPLARAGNSTQTAVGSTSFPPDLFFTRARNSANDTYLSDRLRGNAVWLDTAQTFSESDLGASPIVSFNQNGWTVPAGYAMVNQSGINYVDYFMQRAPSFFDEVCYTGTGAATTVNHNLGVVPELLIIKSRTGLGNWPVWSKYENQSIYYCAYLNTTDSYQLQSAFWGNTGNANMTSATFSLGTAVAVNGSANTFVAYLFASCPGVSKVGSYTGNGSSQTINCGFSGGARFILIKRTNTIGDWYVWDTARGIFIATDPHLSLNTTAAEVSTDDSIDADASGFIVNQLVSTNINVTSATYIYLAIA